MFLSEDVYEDLHPAIRTELARLEAYEAERAELAVEVNESRFLEHVLLEFGLELGSAYDYDLAKYELFSATRPHAIKSTFNQNLIRTIRKEDAEDLIDSIFENRSPEYIFRLHIYNKVIVNACNDNRVLSKKYIYPYLEIIASQIDGVLFLYGRYLESIGDIEKALWLIDLAKNKGSFNYLNIAANCTSKRDFDEAMSLNDRALAAARSRQQRAQIQHNQASLIFANKVRFRFDEAKVLCEASISNATKLRFFWPRNLLLRLNLSTCSLGEVGEEIQRHQKRFKVPLKELEAICQELDDRRVRKAAIAAVKLTIATLMPSNEKGDGLAVGGV